MGRERRCAHCGEKFLPDRRNRRHQKYCQAVPCKAASKKASQAKWLAKNRDYHRGAEAVARVQAWRRAHPAYSRTKPADRPELPDSSEVPPSNGPTLAEVLAPAKRSCNAPGTAAATPLQDVLASQPIVLVGLVRTLTL